MAQRRSSPNRPAAQDPASARRRWSLERDAHLSQVNAFSFLRPERAKRSATKIPAALRFAQHLPAGRIMRALLAVAAPAYAALQLSQGAQPGRAVGFAVLLAAVIFLVSTYRLTVSNHGISFDIAGLRQVSSFGFLPLYAVRDAALGPTPEDWPKAGLKGGWWPGRQRVTVLHGDATGAPKAFYVWIDDPDGFGLAVLGRPLSDA